ncbi:MAG: Rrf2 family transcriptional regulator [Clostridiales bacterium]|nr:Rrf2 family transcriptional regulator [Clostridiales bacterium]
MRISTKGRYGLRAMVDLAVYSSDIPIPLSSIAERQNLSLGYMEQVFSVLRKAGLVKSIKGAQGGYVLGDNPANITVGHVLRALEGDLRVVGEEETESNKKDIEYCIKTMVWDKMNEILDQLADSISLKDLTTEYEKLSNSWVHMYHI